MELILFTGNECGICHAVEEQFRKRFAKELDGNEAQIINLDENEGAQQFWMENELPVAPVIVVMTESDTLVAVLDTEALLKEAAPAAPAAEGVPE